MNKHFLTISSFLLAGLYACGPETLNPEQVNQFGNLPVHVISPRDNPISTDKVELGKALFWDPIMSGNRDVACVTCHHPNNNYAEFLDLSIGVGGTGLSANRRHGTLVKRNAPTVLNTAYNGINSSGFYSPETAPMFWDNRNQSLEEQAIQPLLSAEEMRGTDIAENQIMDTIIQRLNKIPEYVAMFENAFGPKSISTENIGRAIASFERTLTANNSRFDQYVRGDQNALSSFELRGMSNFMDAGCISCHSGPMFSDYELHVLTVPENRKLNEPDNGDGQFAFRTPTLRNLNKTGPYMHNGVFNTLEEVMEFYDDVDDESQNPHVPSNRRAAELDELDFPDRNVEAIIAFLNTLNDDNFNKEIPDRVPSGLNPGGKIN